MNYEQFLKNKAILDAQNFGQSVQQQKKQANAQIVANRIYNRSSKISDTLSKIATGKAKYDKALTATNALPSSRFQSPITSKLGVETNEQNPFVEIIGDNWTEDQKNTYYYLLSDNDDKAREYARSVNAFSKTSPVLANPITEGQAQMEVLAKDIADLERKQNLKTFEDKMSEQEKNTARSYYGGVGYAPNSKNKSKLQQEEDVLQAQYDLIKQNESTTLAKKYIENYNTEEFKSKAAEGYNQFLKDELETKNKKSEESTFEKGLKASAQTSSGSEAGTLINIVAENYRNDRSYMLPNDNWTDEQKNIFGYFYASNKNDAYNYAIDVNEAINRETAFQNKENLSKEVTKNVGSEFAHSLNSVPANVIGGAAEYLDNLIEGSVRGTITTKSNLSPQDYAQTVRQAVSENHEWKIGNVDMFDFVYNSAMSGVDSLFAGMFGSGGGLLLGASAAANTIDDIRQRGGTIEQAIIGGTISGIFEGVFEHFSLGELDKMKGSTAELFAYLFANGEKGFKTYIKQLGKDIAKSMVTNASEEFMTEVANILYDTLANGSASNYAIMVAQYMSNGDSEAVARQKAANQLTMQTVEAAASGAFMGLGFGMLGTTSAYFNANKNFASSIGSNYRDYTTELIESGLELPEGTQSRKLAEQYQKKIENGQELTNAEITKLYEANVKQVKKEGTVETNETTYALSSVPTETLRLVLDKTKGDVSLSTLGITDQATQQQLIDSGVADYNGNINRASLEIELLKRSQEAKGYNALETAENRVENLDLSGFDIPSRNYDNAVTSEISPISSDTQKQGETTQPTETTNTGDYIRNLSAVGQKFDAFQSAIAGVIGDRAKLTTDQYTLKQLGEAFGRNVQFKNLDEQRTDENGNTFLFSPDGAYDPSTNTITLNTSTAVKHSPAEYLIKHEITHLLEKSTKYADLQNAIFESNVFKQYYESLGFSSLSQYKQDILNTYRKNGVKGFEATANPDVVDRNVNAEITANFVGDVLFGGRQELTADLLESLAPKQRKTFVEWVKSIFAKLKQHFGKNRNMYKEITALEKQFLEVAKSVDTKQENKKTTTNESGGMKYSKNSTDIVDLSLDKALIERIENSDKSAITVMRDYIFEKLGGRDIKLSDGILAIVDKTDARHIGESAKSTSQKAQISEIEKIIKLAKFYNEIDVTHNKFSKFRYYELPVRYGENISFITLNVGKGKNDGKYHIYDLTKPKERNTPNRINGFVRPVGNALGKGVSKYSIPTTAQNVNSEVEYSSSKTDQEYLSAVENGDMETAQKMVDKAAKEAGYSTRGYHGTGDNFNIFSEEKISGRNVWGKGFYFGTSKGIADDYASYRASKGGKYRIVSAALKMENSFTPQKSKLGTADEILDTWFSDMWKNSRELGIGYIQGKLENSPLDLLQFIAEHNNIEVRDVLKHYGYDSVKDGGELVVFSSNQIKFADPVTYDENGNVIPLSKRFNEENEDIRYSLPREQAEDLLERFQNGEITKQQYLDAISGNKELNPVQIAQLPKDAANTTPDNFSKPRRVGTGNKESKLYGSLLESEIVTDAVKDEIANNTFIKNYGSTTNKRTLNMALQELEEGGQERVWQFNQLAKQPEKANAVDVAVGLILLERYQREGMIEQAVSVAEILRQIGTVSGQTVQIFSVIGRFNPNMMVAYAKKELQSAYDELVKGKTKHWIDKNKDMLNLTEDEIEGIRRRVLLASQMEDGSRTKAVLLGEICAIIQNKIPAKFGDSIRAFQRISLLLNPKTNVRNIVGNAAMVGVYISDDFFGNLIDKAISKKTNVRTTGTAKFNKETFGGFKKGAYETLDDFKRGIHTKQEELNRFDTNIGQGKSFNENHKLQALNKVAKALNTLDNFTSFCLELGDRPFFEMWYINSLNNQMRLNNVDVPTVEMMEIAKEEALQRTWQNDSALARGASHAKKSLNDITEALGLSINGYGLGDVAIKFTKTPANIATAIVEYSPLGFKSAIKNGLAMKNAIETGKFTPQMQKQYVNSLSRAITGTLTYAIIAALGSLGWLKLSASGDEDKDISNFEKYIVGIPPYSMELFGANVTYDWMQPIGSILAVVADVMESNKDGVDKPFYEDLFSAFKAGGKAFAEQSFLRGLSDLFSSEDLVDGVITAAMNEPAAFTPTALSQVASFTDPYRRTTYEKGNVWQTAVNKILTKLPYFRTTLSKQVNVLGEDVENLDYLNPWRAFIAPANKYPQSSGEVAEEIYNFYQQTGDKTIFPRVSPNDFTVKGTKITFTAEQKAQFQREVGQTSVEILDKMLKSAEYNNLDDKEKIKAIKKVYDYATAKAKANFKYDYDYELLSKMVGENKNGTPILSEEKYKKLDDKAKQILINEYYMSDYQVKAKGNVDKLIKEFIKRSKE